MPIGFVDSESSLTDFLCVGQTINFSTHTAQTAVDTRPSSDQSLVSHPSPTLLPHTYPTPPLTASTLSFLMHGPLTLTIAAHQPRRLHRRFIERQICCNHIWLIRTGIGYRFPHIEYRGEVLLGSRKNSLSTLFIRLTISCMKERYALEFQGPSNHPQHAINTSASR